MHQIEYINTNVNYYNEFYIQTYIHYITQIENQSKCDVRDFSIMYNVPDINTKTMKLNYNMERFLIIHKIIN